MAWSELQSIVVAWIRFPTMIGFLLGGVSVLHSLTFVRSFVRSLCFSRGTEKVHKGKKEETESDHSAEGVEGSCLAHGRRKS